MRKDMNKIIVEKGRLGGNYNRKGRSKDFDSLPNKESMKKRITNRKSLNENLNPLKRFLFSKVGKKWDKVFSEICKNLNSSNTVQQHVKDHVFDFVNKDVFLDGKKVLKKNGNHELWDNSLYVCPKTGILKKYSVKQKIVKKIDYFSYRLNNLSNHKSKLVFFEDELYKVFEDKKTKEWSIFEKANSTHAKIDFNDRWTYFKQEIIQFFSLYEKIIDLKSPYFKKYIELINSSFAEPKPKIKESLYKVGVIVEISLDGGKTWKEGSINRIEKNINTKDSFWISVLDKNIEINPYIRSHQIRLKK